MDPIEKSLSTLSKQANVGSRRPSLIPPISAAPLNVPVGSQWVNTTENNVGIQTPAGIVKLSPMMGAQANAAPNAVLPLGEGSASYFQFGISIPRACRLRTFLELQFFVQASTGTANVITFNNVYVKQQLWVNDTSYHSLENDTGLRSTLIADNGVSQYFNAHMTLTRVWDFQFPGPSTSYAILFWVWKGLSSPGAILNSYNLLRDYVDVIA